MNRFELKVDGNLYVAFSPTKDFKDAWKDEFTKAFPRLAVVDAALIPTGEYKELSVPSLWLDNESKIVAVKSSEKKK